MRSQTPRTTRTATLIPYTTRFRSLDAGLHAGLVQKRAKAHAGIDHAVHHAVGELAAVELRAAPLHAGVGRALQEVDSVLAREALDVRHGEDQRCVDETRDHQAVLGGIDFRSEEHTSEIQSLKRISYAGICLI